jgi:putative transposase
MARGALDRYSVLRPHIEDGVPLTVVAADSGIPLRTVQRWHAAYRESGRIGLESAPRSDKGTRRLPIDLVHLIEGLALVKPRASIATIARRASAVAAANNWKPPSYSVVRQIVTGIQPDALTLAHDGDAAYRDKFELVWRRSAAHPNDQWQADHTMLDVLVVDASGHPARPWLTVIEDDHSRAICGYYVFLGAPSAMNTGLALRQAIWHKPDQSWPICGIPDMLYVDHGSDFTSHQLATTALDLKFQITYSTVARPQGRGKIERFFRSINTELLPELPGYLAPDQRNPQPGLTLAQLSDRIGHFLTTTYQHRVHPELGVSPHAAWTRTPWLPRMPESLDSLDELLLTVAKTRVVHRDGIRFQGLRYISPILAAYVGEAVAIRYDPRDITEVRVFHRNQFVCKAVDTAHQGETFTLKDIQAARNARRRAVRAQVNERIAVVAEYLPEHAPRRTPPPNPQPKTAPKPKLRTYLED